MTFRQLLLVALSTTWAEVPHPQEPREALWFPCHPTWAGLVILQGPGPECSDRLGWQRGRKVLFSMKQQSQPELSLCLLLGAPKVTLGLLPSLREPLGWVGDTAFR